MGINSTMIVIFVLTTLVLHTQAGKEEHELDLNQNDYQMKFERMELVRYNKDVAEMDIVTFKYNRSTTATNVTFTYKIAIGKDLRIVVQAYKFMSNEYRLFPVHFSANVCKAIIANVGGIKNGFSKCGNVTECPFVKSRKYRLCNWVPDQSKLPPFVPNGQYMVEMEFLYFSTYVATVNGYVTIFRPVVWN